MANRRFIDFPIAASVGDNDIVLIWQDGLNKQTTKSTLFAGSPSTLASLTDVDISALTNGQILQYNSTTSKWENVDRTDIDLDQLGDVTIVSPTNGQVLVYNSSTSKWENSSGGFVPYTGAVTTVNLGAQSILAGTFVKAGGTSAQFLKADGSVDSTAYGTGSVTSVGLTMPSAFNVASSPVTTNGTIAVTGAGTTAQYVRGDGSLASFPSLTGFVPYTGATADVDLGTHDLTAERGTFANNGSSDTLTVNHTSGSGYGIKVTKGGNNEALLVTKTSGSGNAMAVVGGRTALVDLSLSSVSNATGNFLTISGGVVHQRTPSETRSDVGAQAQLNGTGFVKASGTTITYDNSTYQVTSEKGQPNGYASLDGNGKVPLAQINDALIGNVNYQGLWNAATNNPTLVNPPSSGTKGYYYIVSTAGTFAGISFEVGDWIISNGSAWQKVDNTDAVSSVFGRTGNVTASNGDYNTSQVTENTNLYYTEARVSANTDVAANTAARHNAVTLGTANGLSLSTQQLSLQLATSGQNGALSSTDWTTFNNKENAITAGTTAQYFRGDKTFQTLNTAAVPESGNLYFTNARAIASVLTGYTSGAGTISAADSILSAIQKLNGNIGGLVTGVSSVNGQTGAVTLTTSNIAEGTNLYFTQARVSANTDVAANTAARHAAVTLGTANGLSLSTQQLSLGLASAGVTGALSGTDWSTFNSKQQALNGTGFVKISGTTISYDNSTYLTTAAAASTYLPLTGGTLTGQLIGTNARFVTSTLNSSFPAIFLNEGTGSAAYGQISAIDFYHGIILRGIPTNNTDFSVTGGDQMSFYEFGGDFRFYKKNGSILQLQASIIEGAGNFISSVTATSFVKSGGTSSQFLKADGSVDSNSYYLASNPSAFIALTALSGTAPIQYNNTTGAISITQSSGSTNGFLSSTDWTTFNNKTSNVGTVTSVAALTLGTTGTDLSSTVANSTTTPVITLNVPTASASNRGALSAADWTTFNSKENAITAGTTAQYYRGDKTFQTLNTAAVPELTNLYYTEARVNANTNVAANTAARHNAVTLGTANGLSLSTQQLSLGLASSSANGALSSTDWTTFNNKQNALTNPVTGTGTTNYLPKFTGASTIGNSQIFDNGSNVGVGTDTPSALFTVSSVGFDDTFFRVEQRRGGYASAINLVGATDAGAIYNRISSQTNGGTTHWQIGGGAVANTMAFYTSGTERMRLTSSGNLGLGVTPSAWSGKSMQIVNSSLTDVASSLQLSYNGYFDGSNWRYITSAAATNYYQTDGAHIWRIAPSGTAGNAISFTQAMTLGSNSGLSIGTPSAAPSQGLLVQGEGRFTDNLLIEKGQNTTTKVEAKNTTIGTSSDAAFLATSDSSAGTTVFGKKSSGVTTYKILTQSSAYWYNGTAGDISIINDFSSGAIKLAAGGSSSANLTIASTGAATFSSSVTANTFVEIVGDLRFNSNSADRTIFFRGSAGSPDTNWKMGNYLNPTGATTVTLAATVIDVFGGAAGYGFMVRNTSNSPLLQIAGNTGAATFSSSVTATAGIFNLNTTDGGFKIVGVNATPPNLAYLANNYFPKFYTRNHNFGITIFDQDSNNVGIQAADLVNGTSAKALIFNPYGGNVGIGTASPNYLLHIAAGAANPQLQFTSTGTGSTTSDGFHIGVNNSTLNAFLLQKENADLQILTNDTERIRITSGGNVLIGTTTDNSNKLRVNGNVWVDGNVAVNALTCTSGEANTFINPIGSSGIIYSGASTTGIHQFLVNSAEQFAVTNTGIRTSAPTGGSVQNWKLGNAVNGTVNANRLIRVEIAGVGYDLVARQII
jgi:hypothetical protein